MWKSSIGNGWLGGWVVGCGASLARGGWVGVLAYWGSPYHKQAKRRSQRPNVPVPVPEKVWHGAGARNIRNTPIPLYCIHRVMGQVTFMADVVDKDWMHELESIMSRLRAKDGCPWDREQDHVTLQRYLIEEAYELIDAIDDGDDEHLVDELGDVLLQVVFHCQIARETERFDLQDVARTISEKLLRRHPHVFGDTTVDDADGVVRQWEEIKREESTGRKRTSHLDGVPRHLPALLQAEKIQKKAAKVGFDWPNIDGVIEKLDEELAELKAARAAGDAEAVAAEAGDLLFTIVNFSRFCKFNAEDALRGTVGRFRERFSFIEQELQRQGRTFEASSLAELDALWDEAKRRIEDEA